MKYDDLTLEEKFVFDTFILLLKSINYSELFVLGNNNITKGFAIYKENNKWKEYVIDECEIIGYVQYENIYDLCMNSFNYIDKENRDYCIVCFPLLIKERENINKKELVKVKKI